MRFCRDYGKKEELPGRQVLIPPGFLILRADFRPRQNFPGRWQPKGNKNTSSYV